MALIAANAASDISTAYNAYAAINAAGQPTGEPSSGNFAAGFASAYHNYASAGQVLGAISGGGNQSIIQNFMDSVQSNSQAIPDFAKALADYWAGVAVKPGTPAHGGVSVVSVTNDAASKVSAFLSAITESYTTDKTDPGFQQLIENIENIALTAVTWTVTEQMPDGGSQDFSEVVT